MENALLPKNGMKGFNTLDVGAGCGETALFFLPRGAGRIRCAEPEAVRVRILRENATRNHWPVTIIDRPFSLEMLTADIDFLKMDCEGCESALLNAKMLRSCALEVHKWELCQELCTKFDLRIIEKSGLYWILRFGVWTAMPAVATETYGTTTHRIVFLPPGFDSEFDWSVNCRTASNRAGAFLKVRHSTDGSTWNDLGTSSQKVLLDSTNSANDWKSHKAGVLPANLRSTCISGIGTCTCRVMGEGRGGTGDNLAFGDIEFFLRGTQIVANAVYWFYDFDLSFSNPRGFIFVRT